MSVQRNTHGFPMPKAGKEKNPFSKKGTIPVDDLEQYKVNPKKAAAPKPGKRLVVSTTPDDLNDGDARPTKAKTKGGGSDVNPFDSIAKDLMASNRKEDAKWTKRPADEPEADDNSVQTFKKEPNAKSKKSNIPEEMGVPEGDEIPARKINKTVKKRRAN